MQPTNTKVWYKQFWPWFLIFVPFSSMVLSFTMMTLAFTGEDSMVIDDYYKEGRGINIKLQKIENAKALNIVTSALITAQGIEVSFLSGQPEDGQALTLDFFHSTQKHKDFAVTLLRDANGIYRAPLQRDIPGKWKLSLHPVNSPWKIQKVVHLPKDQPFELKP
jgi:hypothetical protein